MDAICTNYAAITRRQYSIFGAPSTWCGPRPGLMRSSSGAATFSAKVIFPPQRMQ
jgi:hypothetical protein